LQNFFRSCDSGIAATECANIDFYIIFLYNSFMVEASNAVPLSPRSRLLEALEDEAVQYRRVQDLVIDGKPALQVIGTKMSEMQYNNVVTAMGDDLVEGLPSWTLSNERPPARSDSGERLISKIATEPAFILRR